MKDVFNSESLNGNTAVFVALSDKITGIISIADTLRADSREIIARLTGSRIKLSLLTGDHRHVAEKIAREVSINDYHPELFPGDKVALINQFESVGEKTCMVGDGINDAPALKSSHVGIAMAGIGTDITAESADIVLVKDDIGKLPYLINLSKKVLRKINQNIMLSLVINLAAVILAGLGLINPVSGALVHNVGSILVVFNAALLLSHQEAH